MKRIRQLLLLALTLPSLAACATYTTPGGPADFSKLGLTPDQKAALTNSSVQQILNQKPLVTFPATIAVVRVQAADYDSYSYHTYRWRPPTDSAYSVITVHDVETDADFDTLKQLPKIAAIAPLSHILLTNSLTSDLQLREAAARLHANLLLYYTFDTNFDLQTRVRPLGVISLGLFPNKSAKVSVTASAVLMDVNNGYVYTVAEANALNHQLTNAWESDQAMDDARHRAEHEAFQNLLSQFKSEWPNVLANYDKPAPK